MRQLAGALVASMAVSLSGCTLEPASDEELVEEVASPLYESTEQHWTARLALREAQRLTVAGGSRVEYCGLVVRRADGRFRAGYPTHSSSRTFCSATIGLAAGESVVGYYHTHPAGVQPHFSPEDYQAARAQRRHYYLAASDSCGYRYDPFTNLTWHLGCPF